MRDRPSEKHRQVAAAAKGRPLTPAEVVHHRDEDKANNSKGNLAIEDRGKHTAAHNAARGLSRLRGALKAIRQGGKTY